MDITAAAMRAKYKTLSTQLDERSLRLCAAGDAKMFGYGGVRFVAKAAGLSRTTLYSGSAPESTGHRSAPWRTVRVRARVWGRQWTRAKRGGSGGGWKWGLWRGWVGG